MSMYVPPTTGTQDPAAVAAAKSRPRTGETVDPSRPAVEATPGATVDTMPSRPPAEVLAEMEAAGRRYDELRADQRELHFSRDPVKNRVVVEVRDLDGNVLRTIPPSKALGVIAGGPLD